MSKRILQEGSVRPSIPLHPMVFSLKAKIDVLERRISALEAYIKNPSDIKLMSIKAA